MSTPIISRTDDVMTPADLAMKRALDEGAQYGCLPPMAAAANPSLIRNPEYNLTTFTLRSQKSSERTGPSLSTPFTPQLTLRQFRQFQQSPVISSSPDLDYRRVRRKKSYAQLAQPSFDSAHFLPPTTSSLPLGHTTSSQSFLPSLLPPLPLTPVPHSGTKAPSLSSTVDTIQSTPTHTPVQHGSPDFGQWREFERVELSEPIRTKRRFPLFKQAKRLPHHTALEGGGGGGSVWEVHAVVIDAGGVASGSGSLERFERGVSGGSATKVAVSKLSGKKGRSVRFKGIEGESDSEQSRVPESLHSEEEKVPSLTSSFSLSKFAFPEPPGRTLAATFGQHGEPTPPTSPATLHYKGASFDVVNPHESLILGSSEIETPAEIDGLLDDYFNSTHDLGTMLPYDDFTGEMSTSQQSLPTAGSNGRQRVLYDDAESARRRIMGIQDGTQSSAVNGSPYQDFPLANRAAGHYLPGSLFWPQSHPGMTVYGLDGLDDDVPRGIQIHRNLTEALRRSAATRPNDNDNDGFENVDLGNVTGARNIQEDNNQGEGPGDMGDDAEQARVVDRGSSLYPHSQRSDPFPLTVSDLVNEQRFNKIDEVVSGGRPSSYYAGNAAYYDREEDFKIYEDVADANATQNALESETTLGNIVSHYNYSRPPLFPRDDAEMTLGDARSSSPSVENLRAYPEGHDVFREQTGNTYYNMATGAFEIPGRTSRLEHRPDIAFGRPQQRRRIPGPPNVPAPAPPPLHGKSGAQYYSGWSDLPTTDQTYGNTGQLLQLTPQESTYPPYPGLQGAGSATYAYDGTHGARRHVRRRAHFTGNEAFGRDYDEGEDKENTPPGPSRAERGAGMQSGLAVPRPLHRSSSYYPDDESVWESTQASESRANLADPDAIGRPNEEERPSQESYANTSRCSTDHRLSVPRQAPIAGSASRRPSEQISGMAAGQPRVINPAAALPTWREEVPTEETKAKGILGGKFREDVADIQELDRLGKTNPAAFRKAKDFFADKFGRLKLSPPKAAYSPKDSFSKAIQLGSNRDAHQSASSDTQGLLNHRGEPVMSGGLRFSETTNTFMTSPRTPVSATKPYSPLHPTPVTPAPVTPPASALVRGRATTESTRATAPRSNQDTPITDNIELRRMRKKKPTHVSRAAMSSQTELQPLALVESTASAASRRLTVAEFLAAEPGWTAEPDFSRTGALAQYFHRADAFGIQQPDGTVERVSLLMRPEEARNIGTRRSQRKLTRWYFRVCILCPLTAILFGLGGLDWRMRQITKGRITEMSPTAKKQALEVYVALGIIAWSGLGVMIAMSIIASKGESYA